MKPEEIVSAAALTEAAGNANFGSAPLREVLAYALLQSACGFSTGHTVRCIMEDLALVGLPRPGRARKPVASLSKKGRQYLWAVFGKQSF